MKIGFEGLVILSTIIIISYFVYNTYFDDNLEKVVSSLDAKEYLVQYREDSIEAANLLAEVRRRLIMMAEHLRRTYSADDAMIVRMNSNFNPDVIQERELNSQYTSYTENKGQKIVLCLRNGDQLAPLNLVMFVALHEFTHIVCDEYGHTEKFWQQFAMILQEAINIGIYMKQDYEKYPEEYCGIKVTSSPLD
jgi:predicted metal-dependent hydrolase